jgi:formate hydrogenlyase transcriptional activator
MQRLASYSWPGNIRELQNVIERAVVLASGPVLALDQEFVPLRLPPDTLAMAASSTVTAALPPTQQPPSGVSAPGGPTELQEVEKSHILSILKKTNWVIEGPKGAATILRIHPNTLRNRLKKLGLRKADYEIS